MKNIVKKLLKLITIKINAHHICPLCKGHHLNCYQVPDIDGELSGPYYIYCNTCKESFTEEEVEKFNQERKRKYGLTIKVGKREYVYCFN